MKKFFKIRNELFEQSCPTATIDISTNTKNRQKAIDFFLYGPANPTNPGDHWKQLGEVWGISESQAKTMKCENCAAFDVSDKMRKCIEAGMKGKEVTIDSMATINEADLGYCNVLHFKCAGSRSCKLWLVNGPIDNEQRTDN